MTATMGDDALTQVLRKTILALVRRDEADRLLAVWCG